MKTPFKLKSGNKSSFKNLGSSPIYQKPGGIKGEAIDHWNKYKSSQAKWAKAHDAAIDRLATNPKTANLPAKEFDALLDKTSKLYTKQAPKAKVKAPKAKVSVSKLPPLSTAKKELAKKLSTKTVEKGDLVSKKPTSITSGTTKAMKNVPKQFTNLSKTKMLKEVPRAKRMLKQVVKAGRIGLKGSIAGGLITEGLLAAYKSGQKHSGGKAVKGQKTGVVAPKKSIFKKKDRY